MSLFGSRKSRSTRVASIRASSSLTARLDGVLRDRNVLLRLILSVAAVLLLTVAVQGWKPGFPYRLGSRVDNGVTAGVDFKLENAEMTRRARDDRLALVPFVFQHDPAPLSGLVDLLRSHLGAVAEAEHLGVLPDEPREAFGLAAGNDNRSVESLTREFATVKSALASGGDSTGSRIDEIIADFEQLIAPIRENGIVDPSDLERLELIDLSVGMAPSEHAIEVVSSEEGRPGTSILGEQQLDQLLNDSGAVGKMWTSFPRLQPIQSLLEVWIRRYFPVTLQLDMAATLARRDQAISEVGTRYDAWPRGSRLLEPGERITEQSLILLQAEYDQRELLTPVGDRIVRFVTVFLMFGVMAVLFGFYVVRNERRLAGSSRRLLVFLGTFVAAAALARTLSFDPWRAEIIPLTAAAMLLAIAYNQVLAMLTAMTLSLVIAQATTPDLGHFVVLIAVSITSIIPLSRVASRSALIKVGFLTGVVYVVIAGGAQLVTSASPAELLTESFLLTSCLRGAGWCLVCGYLVAGSLPFIESRFGVVTDISLKEMSDISHPLLQELVRAAPGTYNHSIAVATIGEAAADAIGANGLLVRVGAYFHDIGKMLKPEYFIENLTGDDRSRHERLAPAMSTLIIIGHVKDGVDLALQHHLPQPLIDFIEQHHGTTLVEYFFHEATRQVDEDHKTDADESTFRYPGPKPQTREAGVMMLADGVESASRTLSDPTPKRIETLVHEITMKRLLDGQFDECSLKLSEIHVIEESLIKSLIGIYHGRIKYPEQQTA